MARRFRGKSTGSVWLVLSFVLTLAAGCWPLIALVRAWEPPPGIGSLEWVRVTRGDLDTTLLAGGDLQPAKQTSVTCQVEDITDSDGTMVLSVIKNGSLVKKGDELCRLDSSALEETGPAGGNLGQPGAGVVHEGEPGARNGHDRTARVSGGPGHTVNKGV